MEVIKIRKRRSDEGFLYEIENFSTYLAELRAKGIDAPTAKYSITIPDSIEQALRGQVDIDEQIALFYRLGPSSGLSYQILYPGDSNPVA